MALNTKLLLIVLDGLPWRNWKKFMGNLEGWVQSGEARVWKMRSVLPSTSACCYASIHTGVSPQVHGILSNEIRVSRRAAGHLLRGDQGRRQDRRGDPFLLVGILQPLPVRSWSRDIEYDEPDGPITPWPLPHHDRLQPQQPDDAERRRPVRDADHADRGATASTTASCTPARWIRWAIATAMTASRWTTRVYVMDAHAGRPSCRAG